MIVMTQPLTMHYSTKVDCISRLEYPSVNTQRLTSITSREDAIQIEFLTAKVNVVKPLDHLPIENSLRNQEF